jgi:hypothetical protein
MKRILLIAVAAAGLSACESDDVKEYQKMENQYHYDHYAASRARDCVSTHLNAMSSSDHVQKWEASLYDAVARECNRLFMPALDKPSVVAEPEEPSCFGCKRCRGCEACTLSDDATLRKSEPCKLCRGCEACLGCKNVY